MNCQKSKDSSQQYKEKERKGAPRAYGRFYYLVIAALKNPIVKKNPTYPSFASFGTTKSSPEYSSEGWIVSNCNTKSNRALKVIVLSV